MKFRTLKGLAAVLSILVPAMVDAQCAVCSNFGQPLGCKWGPYPDGWKSCTNISGGCDMSGDCGIASILDLDGRVRLAPLKESYRMVGPTREVAAATIAVQFASMVASIDCKGRLLSSDMSETNRETVSRIVI